MARDIKQGSDDGKPAVIIYETLSGVIFHVTPITLPTFKAIRVKATDRFPYPKEDDYTVIDENGFEPDQRTDPNDNPEYVRLCREADEQRLVWADRATFDYACKMPKYPTKESLVTAFMPQLLVLREIATLPDDDYEAILFHFVLSWNQIVANQNGQLDTKLTDYSRLIMTAIQTFALTPDEVTAGLRFFRPNLPEYTARKPDR